MTEKILREINKIKESSNKTYFELKEVGRKYEESYEREILRDRSDQKKETEKVCDKPATKLLIF